MKKNTIKIPTQFELFGQTIKVEWVEELNDKSGAKGETRYRENKISLQKNNKAFTHLKSDAEVTYIHEVLHWVLNTLGEDEFNRDENRVDRLAHALHQVFVTSVYGRKKEDNTKTVKIKGAKNKIAA